MYNRKTIYNIELFEKLHVSANFLKTGFMSDLPLYECIEKKLSYMNILITTTRIQIKNNKKRVINLLLFCSVLI